MAPPSRPRCPGGWCAVSTPASGRLRDRRARRPSRTQRDGRASSAPTPRDGPSCGPTDEQIADPSPADSPIRGYRSRPRACRLLELASLGSGSSDAHSGPRDAAQACTPPGRMLVKLAVSRPTETTSRNGHAATIPSPASAPPLPVIPDGRPTAQSEPPARPMPSARHDQVRSAVSGRPACPSRTSPRPVDRRRRNRRLHLAAFQQHGRRGRAPTPAAQPGLLARTLKPIGSALGRHDDDAIQRRRPRAWPRTRWSRTGSVRPRSSTPPTDKDRARSVPIRASAAPWFYAAAAGGPTQLTGDRGLRRVNLPPSRWPTRLPRCR